MRLYLAVSILFPACLLSRLLSFITRDSSLMVAKSKPIQIQIQPKSVLIIAIQPHHSQTIIHENETIESSMKMQDALQIIMSKTISQCVEKFKKEARKADLEMIKARKRTELVKYISREDLLSCFQMCSKKQETSVSLSTIFQNCQEQLFNPILLNHTIVDEKQSISINFHVNFYRQICDQVARCNNIKQFGSLHELILALLSKYTALQIHAEPEYEVQLYNLIDLILDDFTFDSKKKLLEWVSTKESIWLISKIINQFQGVFFTSYPNVFKMIVQGLNANDTTYETEAVSLLTKIIKYYDQQDLFKIYEKYYEIPQILINKVSDKLAHSMQDLIDYWILLLYLFNTFEEAIICYAKSGIISLCGIMIATNEQSNIFGGLQLLNSLCYQIQSQIIIDLLLLDEEIAHSKMWLVVCIENSTYKHPNLAIRKSFIRLMKNLMKKANQSQLKIFYLKFLSKDHNLFACLEWILSSEQDTDIQMYALQCIQRLLFNEREMQKDYLSDILISLEYNNIVKYIGALSNQKRQEIRQICGDILDRIYEIRCNNSMDDL